MRILLLNQCFYPDVVSTAQHLTDLAIELTARGHSVTVFASDRGYDNPSLRFKRKETWNGINIVRIPSIALGKKGKWRRAVNFASFLTLCSFKLLIQPRCENVVALTSPPLISFLAALFGKLKGGRLCLWIMDLNPDEAIAAGWLKSDSFTARLLHRMMDYSLRSAEQIVVLDRFVKSRLEQRNTGSARVTVIPPWAHSDVVRYSSAGRETFRARHGLNEKFVVMYSGNHSPCHPLNTLVQAALNLKNREDIVFLFVGGGSEQAKVIEFAALHGLRNVRCLPYQPLEQLSHSLSAADLHVVVMGDAFVGIVHPCKIYNIMEVGTPVLYIGPKTSHVIDLASQTGSNSFFSASHGDCAGVVKHIVDALDRADQSALATSNSMKSVDRSTHSKEVLAPRLCTVVESVGEQVSPAPAAAAVQF